MNWVVKVIYTAPKQCDSRMENLFDASGTKTSSNLVKSAFSLVICYWNPNKRKPVHILYY